MAGSFHIVMVPPKIPATVSADKFNVLAVLSRYMTAIGAATIGM
jgi:hypothetical protein